MNINTFVDKLINLEAPIPFQQKPRWIYQNNTPSYKDISRLPPKSTKKIETVLLNLSADFKKINNPGCGSSYRRKNRSTH